MGVLKGGAELERVSLEKGRGLGDVHRDTIHSYAHWQCNYHSTGFANIVSSARHLYHLLSKVSWCSEQEGFCQRLT
jgi:hypothetical protein